MLVVAFPSEQVKETFIKESEEFNVKAITGKTVNRNNCVGYCALDEHPGYLTQDMCALHKCLEKECVFFYKFHYQGKNGKQRELTEIQKKNQQEIDDVIKGINSLGIDGFKALSAEHIHTDLFEVEYVAMGTIDEKEVTNWIDRKCDFKVRLKLKNVSFDTLLKMFL